jgi:hypothetical protein
VCRGVLAMSSRARNEWICIAVAQAVQRVRTLVLRHCACGTLSKGHLS